ncbi:MAG: hypothetical protein JNJ46_22510 [Myxococcales bacterium]|nr:hypothetical protein [Myxococcales bacterium]
MPVSTHNDSRELAGAVSEAVVSLSYREATWAQASLTTDGSTVTLGCRSSSDPARFPLMVRVLLETQIPLACIVEASALASWPNAARGTGERPLRGAAQLLRLVDLRGQPWAQIEIGDQVHLFDPSGHERARIMRSWDTRGSRLILRCWDETGKELTHNGTVLS